MTLRSCIYKGCENYINLRDRSFNDVRLFGFPKNPERRKKWIELGKVPPNLPDSLYFFCLDHFDKKFLAINNRRTVLVGEAVPFPYVEPEVDESNKDDLNYLMFDLGSHNVDEEDQEIVVESTTITSDKQYNFNEQQFNNLDKDEREEYITFSDEEGHKEEPISCNINKRKLEIAFPQATSSMPKTSQVQKPLQNSSNVSIENVKLISNVTQTKSNVPLSNKESCEDYMSSNDLVDAKQVTTFIFKGEEFVQMSKDYYLKEKVELMNKVEKMEHALQAIKEHLIALDI